MDEPAKVTESLPSHGDAINKLFAQDYGASLRTACTVLRSRPDAEDAVQTAYCSAFRNFTKFRGELSFKTWITRMVVNCCLMQVRDRRARLLLALDDVLPTLESPTVSPETLCYRAELQADSLKASESASRCLRGIRDFWRCVSQSGRPSGPNGDRRAGTSTEASMINRQNAGAWGGNSRWWRRTRLHCLTTRIDGDARPIQFCRMLGAESLCRPLTARILQAVHGVHMRTLQVEHLAHRLRTQS
jgi:RNA polymerase sigma factor (sigma-70 family)